MLATLPLPCSSYCRGCHRRQGAHCPEGGDRSFLAAGSVTLTPEPLSSVGPARLAGQVGLGNLNWRGTGGVVRMVGGNNCSVPACPASCGRF